MKLLCTVVSLLGAISAQADIIRCTFTEPFYSYTYSMAQQRLYIEGAGVPRYSIRNVAFQIIAPGEFVVGHVSAPKIRLSLDWQGSDGASDFVYPYTAVVPNFDGHGNSLTGGCQSNYLHKRPGAR